MDKKFSAVLSYPGYFIGCLLLGVFAWSFSLENKNETLYQIQLSSEAVTSPEDISDFEFEQKLKDLENENAKHPFDENQPFVLSPQDIEGRESAKEVLSEILQKDAEVAGPFIAENISEFDLNYLVSYEDPISCGPERNYLEKILTSNPKVSEWSHERLSESQAIPRKCLTFALNSYPEITSKKIAQSFKKTKSKTFAFCKNGSKGFPDMDRNHDRNKHAVPCISKSFVNATYNAYADVTSCLRIDPKELFPKIYNESGFYMNALGGSMDAGVGQLTMPAISQVNSIYPKYMEQIMRAAAAKPDGACARLMKYKSFLTPISSDAKDRCALLWPSENPLRNILYMAILSKYNEKVTAGINYVAGEDLVTDADQPFTPTGTSADELGGNLKEYGIRIKLAQLGLKQVNLHHFKAMIVMVGYNSGIGTALKTFRDYLDERIAANKKTKSNKYNLTFAHFDPIATKDLVLEARSMIMSSFIKSSDAANIKAEKVKRRKQLPMEWANAYKRTFPEYLAYKLNSYDGGKSSNYQIYGVANYLAAVALKNKMIRDTFQTGGIDPNYCSDANFLIFK